MDGLAHTLREDSVFLKGSYLKGGAAITDLQGILGLSDEVRNGYSAIRVSFKIAGDASEEKLRAIVEQSRARSAVFDVITNRVPISIDVEAT